MILPTLFQKLVILLGQYRKDVIISLILCVILMCCFALASVNQLTDSTFSMLSGENLLYNSSINLDSCMKKSGLKPIEQYQLYVGSEGKVYYGYPIGTSILSIPAIYLSNLIGYKSILENGSFSEKNEARIQRCSAALTMTLFALILYITARMILPPVISFGCVLAVSLGSQVWSTCSRGMWSHNWLCVLVAIVFFLLLGSELKKIRQLPIPIGLLMGIMFVCRPTAALFIILFLFFVAFRYKFYDFFKCATTAFCCLLLFMLYSWNCFNAPFPPYYMGGNGFNFVFSGVAGVLFSPSRGLFLYVPLWLIVLAGVIILWRKLVYHQLTILALIGLVMNILLISSWNNWHGGFSYGARLLTDSVPFLGILFIFVVAAFIKMNRGMMKNVLSVLGIALIIVSVWVNGVGACMRTTWLWNSTPGIIDLQQERLWDWSDPQFLRLKDKN